MVEMMITMSIVALIAVLLVPKVLSASDEQTRKMTVDRTNIGIQQLTLALNGFKIRNDMDDEDLARALTLDPANGGTNYESIFFFNGNFFSFKGQGAGGALRYFYFADRSRMSFNTALFAQGDYAPTALNDRANGNKIVTACQTGVTTNPSRCAFLDTNGARFPNSFSAADGDIIPIVIDTQDFTAQTLYESTRTTALPNGDCDVFSLYDRYQYPAACP